MWTLGIGQWHILTGWWVSTRQNATLSSRCRCAGLHNDRWKCFDMHHMLPMYVCPSGVNEWNSWTLYHCHKKCIYAKWVYFWWIFHPLYAISGHFFMHPHWLPISHSYPFLYLLLLVICQCLFARQIILIWAAIILQLLTFKQWAQLYRLEVGL